MYPPLTDATFSPGINEDFWLLGIGFIEISAIAGAIEIIVGVLRTRAPGHDARQDADLRVGDARVRRHDRVRLSRDHRRHRDARARARVRLAVLRRRARRRSAPVAAPVLVLRPPRRLHHLPAGGRHGLDDRGDDGAHAARRLSPRSCWRCSAPASWASGCGSTTCSRPAFRHMSLGFFTAASMAVAIPSGIQVFSWIATLAAGNVQWRTPDALRARLPVHLRARRPDRRHGGAGPVRRAGARHVLHRRAPALRADRRHGVPAVRGALLLDSLRQQATRCPSASAAGCSG